MRILISTYFGYCITFLLMTYQYAAGQQQDLSLVHFDKPYYVAGEVVNYQVFLPMAFRSQQSIMEALIYDFKGVVKHQSFLKKNIQNISSGFYKVPYDIDPGVHHLIINALDEKAFDKIPVALVPLPIYGARMPPEHSTETSMPSSGLFPANELELDVDVRLNSETIKPRDQVKLKVMVNDQNGLPVKASMSISITDMGIIGTRDMLPYRTLYSTPVSLVPEINLSSEIPVFGQLESHRKGLLLTFFIPATNTIHYTTTGDNGNFQLMLPEYYGEQDLHYIGYFSDDVSISLTDQGTIGVSEPLFYNQSIASYIDESKKRRNIYQLYNRTEPMPQHAIPENGIDFVPDREYNAKNYPFQDLPSFCKALSTQLKYIKDKVQGHQFKIFDPETRDFLFGTPLFIVDGQLTKNTEYVASLDFQEFDRIMMFYETQHLSEYFGFAGYGGVVKIDSKQGNIKVPESSSTQEFQISGLQPVPREMDPAETDATEPLFRPQLLWKPALETNSQGQLEIEFQQSDDISLFQIEVVVQAEDGRRGHGTLEYQVYTGLSNSSK